MTFKESRYRLVQRSPRWRVEELRLSGPFWRREMKWEPVDSDRRYYYSRRRPRGPAERERDV